MVLGIGKNKDEKEKPEAEQPEVATTAPENPPEGNENKPEEKVSPPKARLRALAADGSLSIEELRGQILDVASKME